MFAGITPASTEDRGEPEVPSVVIELERLLFSTTGIATVGVALFGAAEVAGVEVVTTTSETGASVRNWLEDVIVFCMVRSAEL